MRRASHHRRGPQDLLVPTLAAFATLTTLLTPITRVSAFAATLLARTFHIIVLAVSLAAARSRPLRTILVALILIFLIAAIIRLVAPGRIAIAFVGAILVGHKSSLREVCRANSHTHALEKTLSLLGDFHTIHRNTLRDNITHPSRAAASSLVALQSDGSQNHIFP
jgi:hypothetical protein